jgi:hypothetical protein
LVWVFLFFAGKSFCKKSFPAPLSKTFLLYEKGALIGTKLLYHEKAAKATVKTKPSVVFINRWLKFAENPF